MQNGIFSVQTAKFFGCSYGRSSKSHCHFGDGVTDKLTTESGIPRQLVPMSAPQFRGIRLPSDCHREVSIQGWVGTGAEQVMQRRKAHLAVAVVED